MEEQEIIEQLNQGVDDLDNGRYSDGFEFIEDSIRDLKNDTSQAS